MYKDKDKQRKANRLIQAKRRSKGMTGCDTKGVTSQGVTVEDIKDADQELAASDRETTRLMTQPKRGKDIKCFKDLPVDVQATINRVSESNEEKQKRTVAAIKYQHLFPDRYYPQDAGVVTGKPGDADYNGICTEEWRQERGR